MNIKKIPFLLIIITILFLLPQTTDAEDTNNGVCVTQQECLPSNMANEEACGELGGVFLNLNDHPEACQEMCCCSDEPQIQYKGFCEKHIEAEATFPMDGKTCVEVCASLAISVAFTITGEIQDTEENNINGNYVLYFDLLGGLRTDSHKQGTFTNGALSISDVISGSYNLVVTSNNCRNTTSVTVLNEDVDIGTLQIDLNCEEDEEDGTGQDECVSLWHYEFSGDGCGLVLSVNDLNNCNEPYPEPTFSENEYIPCTDLPVTFPLCGNQILDEGEMCDVVNGVDQFAPGLTCETFGFDSGFLRCEQCIIDTTFCSNCPAEVTGCDETMCDCDICEETIFCSSEHQCNAQEDTLTLTVSRLTNQDQLSLEITWDAPERCTDTASISLYKRPCPQEHCEVQTTPPFLVTTRPYNFKPFIDTNFPVSPKNFCYKAKMTTNDNPSITIESESVCKTIPDEICLGKPEEYEFCHENNIKKCVQGLVQTITECTGKCIHPVTSSPICSGVDVCDACSGPFGVFGFAMHKNQDFLLSHQDFLGLSCSDLELFNYCFREDYSQRLTAIGLYNHCGDISSCYDYKTKGTCERNPCQSEGITECKWNSLGNLNELGIGVCVPKNNEEQNCNMCDLNSPNQYCSPEMCDLHGDCYYNPLPIKAAQSNPFIIRQFYCNNKDEVGCETYHTEEKCEGNSELDIDITYEANLPVSGTNKIIHPSNDSFNRGVCIWLEDREECVRDADFFASSTSIPAQKVSDCANDRLNKNCLLDFTPPNTTIKIRGQEIQDGGSYSTRQLYSQALQVILSEPVKFTRFTITRAPPLVTNYYPRRAEEGGSPNNIEQQLYFQATSPYPNMTFNQFANHVRDVIENDEKTNKYVLSFYSKDLANNLEEVNRVTITLFKKLDINVTHTLVSQYYLQAGAVLSNVTINLSSPQQEYSCKTQLYDLEGKIGPLVTRSTDSQKLSWNYNLLQDGRYRLELICTDEYAQITEINYLFNITEDVTLSDPHPAGQTLKNYTTQIRITSISNANCNYTGIGPQNNNINGTFSLLTLNDDGTYTHSVSVDTTNEGVYIYRPICSFQDDEIGIYQGNNGDLIYFGIDRTPPELKIYDEAYSSGEDLEEYDDSLLPVEQLKLMFKCNDEKDYLRFNGFDLSFGCIEELPFNITHTWNDGAYTEIKEAGTLSLDEWKTFTAPLTYAEVFLKINVSDKGNNYRVHEEKLRLRDLSYEIPTVKICNPELQICN